MSCRYFHDTPDVLIFAAFYYYAAGFIIDAFIIAPLLFSLSMIRHAIIITLPLFSPLLILLMPLFSLLLPPLSDERFHAAIFSPLRAMLMLISPLFSPRHAAAPPCRFHLRHYAIIIHYAAIIFFILPFSTCQRYYAFAITPCRHFAITPLYAA